MSKKLDKKGFTLIEVVLVLAIGGLIFLLAFIAYQQVARNRRDTQRRNDAGRVLAQIQSAVGDGFILNSQTALSGSGTPTTTDNAATSTSFLKTQFSGSMKTPAGSTNYYRWNYVTTAPTTISSDNIYVASGFKCNGTTSLTAQSGSYAVILGLENAGSAICRSDS